jgi:hypothetical protein
MSNFAIRKLYEKQVPPTRFPKFALPVDKFFVMAIDSHNNSTSPDMKLDTHQKVKAVDPATKWTITMREY